MNDRRRTTIMLSDEERASIEEVRKRYGIASDVSVIRLAIKILADAKYLVPSSEPKPIDTQAADVVS